MTKRDIGRFLWWLFVLFPLDTLACFGRQRSNPGKVLVIRLDALGDFLVWLDAARGLRRRYPPSECEITLLANKNWAALAERLPEFDHVWDLDRRKFVTDLVYRWRIVRRLRREGFAVAVSPVFSRDFLWADTAVRASGAAERIGYHGDPSVAGEGLMRLADRWYTRIIRSLPEQKGELERNADFLRGMGAHDFSASIYDLRPLALADAPFGAQSEAQEAYYVLVPGAGKSYREWPISNFARIAERLYAKTGMRGLIAGGKQDAELAQRLCEAADAPLESRAGDTSLEQLVSLIANARLVISNETGAVHIAAALRTPVISITGGGHFGRFVPYSLERPTAQPLPLVASHLMPCFGCNWHCIYPLPPKQPTPCISAITPEAVWDAILTLMP